MRAFSLTCLARVQFEIESITGATVDLIGDGNRTRVTPSNFQEYFDMAVSYRLNEFNRHVRTIVWSCITRCPRCPVTIVTGTAVASRECRGCSLHCQVDAMRRGRAAVVPAVALQVCSWRDLRERVCGDSTIDIDAMKQNLDHGG